jgi:DNA-binding transcriptional regulator LsrR (DeoR family)
VQRDREIDGFVAADVDGDRQVIGLLLDAVGRIPIRVAAGGGPKKVEPLAAASGGGLVMVVVTDVTTAQVTLERA